MCWKEIVLNRVKKPTNILPGNGNQSGTQFASSYYSSSGSFICYATDIAMSAICHDKEGSNRQDHVLDIMLFIFLV